MEHSLLLVMFSGYRELRIKQTPKLLQQGRIRSSCARVGAEHFIPALPQLIGDGPLQRRHSVTDRFVGYEVDLLAKDWADCDHLELTLLAIDAGPTQLFPQGVALGIGTGVEVLADSLERR